MSAELRDFAHGHLPLTIKGLEFHDPAFVLIGDDWSLSVICPWRLVRDGQLLSSTDDPRAEERLRELTGQSVEDVVALVHRLDAHDPVLVLTNGSRLEIFADTDLDPWSLRIAGTTFAGSASASR